MNKTTEQLDSESCASGGLAKALTSPIMKINFVCIISIIIISYYFFYLVVKTLIKNNIFSNCTRALLIFCSINSIVHQTTMMEVRIRQIYRSIVFDEDHCHILFNSSECVFELYFYYMTNYFSTYSVFSLTFDRLIACYFPKLYIKTENLITITLLIIQFSLTVGTHFYAYLGVPLAGYVPMCSYPPQLAIRFDTVNKVRTLVMSCCIVVTLTILYFNIKAEKRIHHNNFDPNQRYFAYEKMTTSKSVCTLIIIQFLCVLISSFGVTILRNSKNQLSEEVYHTIVPFLPGVTYANLCLPIIIYYKTKSTISRRKINIAKLTSTYGDLDSHMKRLSENWA